MFALRNATRTLVANQRRLVSSETQCSTTFLTAAKKQTFSKNWLSDPSVYPLLLCLGGAGGLVVGFSAYTLTTNIDVQINPRNRNSIMRTWGN